MIAAVLTFFGIMFIHISGWGSVTAWVIVGIIALIWFIRMVWIDDARAHINWVDYWSKNGKERAMDRHRWEAEAREEEERLRRKQEKPDRRVADFIAERKQEKAGTRTEEKTEPKAPGVICDKCGKVARQVHRITYPSGKTYVEYQCPYCGDRKLKKAA